MAVHIQRRESAPVEPELAAAFSPLLAQVLANRGIRTRDELALELSALPPFTSLKGIEEATTLLEQALREGQRILIVGDFDADGATSTVVALRALRAMGAASVEYLVPNRFEYGYGLTPEIVEVATGYAPDLLITVDNGISSLHGVAAAQARGIKVLVTDHHLPGAELPPAEAIVNPNQPGCEFPSKHLAGVGVIFYVMSALRARLRESGYFSERGIAEPKLGELLDLVALGTVADVVAMDRVNRILVAQGLSRIRAGRGCAGISTLLRIARRDPARVVSSDMGFAVGPRLNAAGRMDDMGIGIDCLLSDDVGRAERYAAELDALNRERRETEEAMREQALAIVEQMHLEEGSGLPFGLCLYDPEWHQGVVGILASRIKERLHRPVIAFSDSSETEVKGSARSVPGLHIRDALDAVATAHPGMLSKFGGHAMAAGLSLQRDQLEAFKQAFDAEVRRHLTEEELHAEVRSDGELDLDRIDLPQVEQLRYAMPWGQGFVEPIFDGLFDVISRRIVGEKHLKLQLRPAEGGEVMEAIAFFADLQGPAMSEDRLHVAYKLDVNEWRGVRSLQLVVESMQLPGGSHNG